MFLLLILILLFVWLVLRHTKAACRFVRYRNGQDSTTAINSYANLMIRGATHINKAAIGKTIPKTNA